MTKKLSMPEAPIDINEPAPKFEEHLTANSRILFSSAFGTGKTFFLKYFFEAPEIKERYNAFHLFPVNYQVATNEDIFELIKYDIVCHLLDTDWIQVNNEKFSKLLALQSYLLHNGTNVLSKIMQCVPLFCIDKAGKAMEAILNVHKDFLKYRK